MTDKDNSQTGEYSYTYSYSYSKEGGEKNVEVHTGGFSAATAGEAAVDSAGKTTAGESSSGKSATGKTTTIKSTTGKTTTRSRSTTTSSRSSTSSRSKNDNSGPDVGYWIMTAIFFRHRLVAGGFDHADFQAVGPQTPEIRVGHG